MDTSVVVTELTSHSRHTYRYVCTTLSSPSKSSRRTHAQRHSPATRPTQRESLATSPTPLTSPLHPALLVVSPLHTRPQRHARAVLHRDGHQCTVLCCSAPRRRAAQVRRPSRRVQAALSCPLRRTCRSAETDMTRACVHWIGMERRWNGMEWNGNLRWLDK